MLTSSPTALSTPQSRLASSLAAFMTPSVEVGCCPKPDSRPTNPEAVGLLHFPIPTPRRFKGVLGTEARIL